MDAFDGQQVAVWEPEHGTVSFEVPGYVNEPFDGEFITVGGGRSSLQMSLSPAHRVPHFDWAGRFAVKTAEQIAARPSCRWIPTTFTLARPDYDMSDDEIRVRIMFAADGSIQGTRAVVTVRKARKVARVAELLTATGRAFTHKVAQRDKPEHHYRFDVGGLTKDLDFLWLLSTRQLRVALEELLHWDGLFGHVEKRFHTTKKSEAEAVQYAAHACGLRATIRTQTYRNVKWKDGYVVQWAGSEDSQKNRAMWRNDTPQGRAAPTDGRQYCFVTSTGFFVARHNGTVFITGNSGKTSGMYLTLLLQALEQPVHNGVRRSRCMVIRNTRAQLKDSVIKTMCGITPPDGINVVYKEAELSMLVRLVGSDGVPAEILFMFRSLEDEQDTQRLLSVELTWVWISEFSEVDLKIAKAAVSRCGRYPSKAMGGCTHYGLVAESNFPVKDSPWYDFIEVSRPANVEVFKQPSALSAEAENVENLPPGYYQDLVEGADPRWLQSYIQCEYPDSLLGKTVFPNFSTKEHCGKGLRPILIGEASPPLVIGMDAGRNPAAVMGQVQGDGRLNVLAELWAANMAMDEFASRKLLPLISSRFSGLRTIVVLDPAGFAQGQGTDLSPAKALMARGFMTVPAPTNNIAPRLAAVDQLLLAGNGILIDVEHCPQLVTALLRDYIFEAGRNGKLSETPTKAHPVSDLADSLQALALYVTGGYAPRVGRMLRRGTGGAKVMPPPSAWT